METEALMASVRGVTAMVIIAALFGFWQRNVVAGAFMLSFLWFFEKNFRVLINRIVILIGRTESPSS